MNKLTQALMEELTVEYVKVGSLQIPESVVISWVIMLLLVVGSILLTRNLKVDHISKRQAALEALYSLGKNFFEGLLGKEGSRYVPYLMTVALYIACSNVIGVFGVKPPTKDLDVTAALALMSIVLIEYAGVRARGGAGFLKSLAAPTPIMTPMNILEIAIRPTSLCMRLFGNVLGAFVIMELLKLVVQFCESPLAERCEITLEQEEPAEQTVLSVDEALLARLLENLLNNSVRHNLKPVNITVHTRQVGERFCLTVADDGIGYPAAVLVALNAAEPAENAPHILGLYVVQQIAAAHGGTAVFGQNTPCGAKTTVWLPGRA